MRVEIPELKRCCCCMPLRRGLLAWVYLKVALELLMVLFLMLTTGRLLYFSAHAPVGVYITFSIVLLTSLLDIAFCILFLISAHKKHHEHMRIYYRYAIGFLILGVSGLLILIGFEIYIAIISMPYTLIFLHSMIAATCAIILPLLLHGYCIILVRSEILKLERNAKFEFINHTSDPECKARITV